MFCSNASLAFLGQLLHIWPAYIFIFCQLQHPARNMRGFSSYSMSVRSSGGPMPYMVYPGRTCVPKEHTSSRMCFCFLCRNAPSARRSVSCLLSVARASSWAPTRSPRVAPSSKLFVYREREGGHGCCCRCYFCSSSNCYWLSAGVYMHPGPVALAAAVALWFLGALLQLEAWAIGDSSCCYCVFVHRIELLSYCPSCYVSSLSLSYKCLRSAMDVLMRLAFNCRYTRPYILRLIKYLFAETSVDRTDMCIGSLETLQIGMHCIGRILKGRQADRRTDASYLYVLCSVHICMFIWYACLFWLHLQSSWIIEDHVLNEYADTGPNGVWLLVCCHTGVAYRWPA